MKIRKGYKKISYTKEELNKIADEVHLEEYKFKCFREFIWNCIKEAASKGQYNTSISVTGYSDDFINKILDELLRNNIMCNAYTIANSGFFYSDTKVTANPMSIPPTKTLEVCWNSLKAYSHTK